jgi:transcription elongation factor GreA-like protein
VLLSIFREQTHRISALLYFSLGDFVIHPDRPDWGIGQVQSIVGMNVTVNFEHAGKQMINCKIIALNAAPHPTK